MLKKNIGMVHIGAGSMGTAAGRMLLLDTIMQYHASTEITPRDLDIIEEQKREQSIPFTNPYRDLQIPAMSPILRPVRSKKGGSPREWGENYRKKRK